MSWNAIGNCLSLELLGAFHSTKLPKIWKQWQMVQKVSENFPEIPETVEFSEMRIIQPKIPEIPGPKLNGKKTSGKLGINREVILFFRNFGKCCSIRY